MSNERPEAGVSQPRELPYQNEPSLHSAYTAMFLWFMDASWVSKFCGEGGGDTYEGCRAQVEAFLRAQNLNVQQQADFILSTLDGKAHRQIMLLAPEDRDTRCLDQEVREQKFFR